MVETCEVEKSEFYVLRTIPSKESRYIDNIERIISKKENHGIRSVFSPETVKGYVFVEATRLSSLVDALRGIPNNKGVIKNPISFEEISKYFEKDGEAIVVNERDIVEVIAGPFKGDKARVVRIISGKDEIVIEPINAPVPIPITLTVDDVRVLKEENID